jgi:NADP-dependent 3-hydroxy acid dehydrogenase YdfG
MDGAILITGCSSGIGAALAAELARRGRTVVATARKPETLEPLTALGCHPQVLDVTDEDSITQAVTAAESAVGPIGMLVNNAGYGQMGAALDTGPDQLRAQFEANVIGVMNMVRAVTPGMMQRHAGLIVNVGSISAVLTTPFAGPYCASKAAVHALNDALRMELAPWGIRVMLVRPGGVQSRFGDNVASQLAIPADSPYAALADGIHKRAHSSQQGSADADAVASRIADAMLAPSPPALLACGRGGYRYPALKRLLPTRMLDNLLMKRFGLADFEP